MRSEASLNPFDDEVTAARFADEHYGFFRGRVRTALVERQLGLHLDLDGRPLRVVDVGGGSGEQSIPLTALGHHVTIADPSAAMLGRAEARLASLDPAVTDRVDLVAVGAEGAVARLGGGSFDLVLCHGVLLYLDTEPVVRTLVDLAAPGGTISILTCSSRSLALRPGIGGRWEEALRCFEERTYRNELGIEAKADDPDEVSSLLTDLGTEPMAWYGVRLFTDPIRSDAAFLGDPDAFDQVLDAEWEAGQRDPYRQLCRLFHVIARRP